VKDWALESLRIRYDVCSTIAVEIGFEGIERKIINQHTEAMRCISPLIEQIAGAERGAEDLSGVRRIATRMLLNLSQELEAISSLKEVETETFFVESMNLVEMHEVELAFTENVLQTARANPESATLQRIGVQALKKLLDIVKAATVQSVEIETKAAWLDYSKFVLEAMEGHPADRIVQKDSCMALTLLMQMSPEIAEHVIGSNAIDLVKFAMANHTSDTIIQVNGRLAITACETCSVDRSKMMSSGMHSSSITVGSGISLQPLEDPMNLQPGQWAFGGGGSY